MPELVSKISVKSVKSVVKTMALLLKISIRNLIRQKRRNLFLGVGIAFGMCILILANAFSSGLSDILLNRLLVLITGHIRVTMLEKPNKKEWSIIRDKERMRQIIDAQIPGEKEIYELVMAEGRALGNGAAEQIYLAGVDENMPFLQDLQLSAGNPDEFKNPAIENPIIIPGQLANTLHVQVNDTIMVGFETAYRQAQSARFTIVATIQSDIPFFENEAFVRQDVLKPLLGYQANETAAFKVVLRNLKNPQVVLEQANRLHQALQPNAAGYAGIAQGNGREAAAWVFAIQPEQQAQFASNVNVMTGSLETTLADETGAIISSGLAQTLGVTVGDSLTTAYLPRFDAAAQANAYRIGAIFEANGTVAQDMMFVHPKALYRTAFAVAPKEAAALDRTSPLFPMVVKEWRLLERSPDSRALEQKYNDLDYANWRGAVVDVQTMYELASDVLNFEFALKAVALSAVLVLFIIILIGVVNTLRMTIRERTREIGTVRAIGMQCHDVRWTFIMEILILTALASVAGTLAALLLMAGFSQISLSGPAIEGIFKLFLVNDHLYFLPKLTDIALYMGVITAIAFITAYFPSGRAAKLTVVDALRTYE